MIVKLYNMFNCIYKAKRGVKARKSFGEAK